MKKFIADRSCGLKDFTDGVYPQGSFYYSALLRAGDIRVNGRKVRAEVRLDPGDEVVYYTTPKMESKPSHSVIYADERMYAADKFSGVSTEALAAELGLIPVHRLDRNTCGVLLFAADEGTAAELEALFRARAVQKDYVCVCRDGFARDEDDMTAFLVKDEARGLVKVYDRPVPGGVEIRTAYRVLARREGLARALVTLHTGKTHQIRAHLAHIGCPVLGDGKYGDRSLNGAYGLKRQLLCSHTLAFELGGERYCFHSSLAPDFPLKK